tara:strand:- start:183 stop:557 length:375 start_codon:yes stop_codon:yes gene_type:complete
MNKEKPKAIKLLEDIKGNYSTFVKGEIFFEDEGNDGNGFETDEAGNLSFWICEGMKTHTEIKISQYEIVNEIDAAQYMSTILQKELNLERERQKEIRNARKESFNEPDDLDAYLTKRFIVKNYE